jgi:hypothetical protein
MAKVLLVNSHVKFDSNHPLAALTAAWNVFRSYKHNAIAAISNRNGGQNTAPLTFFI